MPQWDKTNISPVFGAKLNSQGSTAVHITLPKGLSYSSSHTDHCGEYRTRPTAKTSTTTMSWASTITFMKMSCFHVDNNSEWTTVEGKSMMALICSTAKVLFNSEFQLDLNWLSHFNPIAISRHLCSSNSSVPHPPPLPAGHLARIIFTTSDDLIGWAEHQITVYALINRRSHYQCSLLSFIHSLVWNDDSTQTQTHSLSQRRPAVPSGQVQVLCGLQVAPCWQGGTQGVVTATGRKKIDVKSERQRSESCRSIRGTLTRFTDLARKSFNAATPVEAHAHSTIPARFLTLNWLCWKQM